MTPEQKEKIREEFEEKVNELRRELVENGGEIAESKTYDFGYKIRHGDDLFIVPDWGNIEKWWLSQIDKAVKEREEKYNELIMAVGNKFEGETRHETALRYILNAEKGSEEAKSLTSTLNYDQRE